MRGLEGVLECLRLLVEAKQWDYCVVWKLGDDPSRFIELVGCCCGGAYDSANVKEEGEHLATQLCRDGFVKHPIKTKACEALAKLPSSMSLYSGVYTEVVISAQPRWFSGHDNASDLNPSQSHDSIGTRVLIPVSSGLIELYATENIPENKKIFELFMAPCNVPLKQEVMTTHGYADMDLNAGVRLHELPTDPLLEAYYPQKFLPSLHLANSRPQVFPSVSPSASCPSLEPSSSSSNPSSEQTLPSSRSKRPKCGGHLFQQKAGLASGGGSVVKKRNANAIRKPGDEHHHSKNLIAERNRRTKIKDGLFALRALVPKITKMDRASILGDAIDYIQGLQKKVEELQDELREIEEEDFMKNKPADVKVLASNMRKEGSICLITADHKQASSTLVQKTRTEVQVEVNQIGERDCLIKLFCGHNRGGFARLMDIMDSLGLQVVDANVTTFDGNALIILKVEANNDIQAKKLRDNLIKLTGETIQTVHCS